MDSISIIIRAHPKIYCELEARDTVFRKDYNMGKRRQTLSWCDSRRDFMKEELIIWDKLNNKDIDEKQAIEMLTDYMEKYYGAKYPLR